MEFGPIPFVTSKAPFADFLVASSKGGSQQDLAAAMASIGLHARSFPRIGQVVYSGSPLDDGTERMLLSGYGQFGGHFFVGSREAEYIFRLGAFRPDDHSLSGLPVGNYSVLAWSEDRIDLFCDPFGQSSLFRYDGGDISIAANSYHLLLLAARALGAKPAWNRPIINATLFSESGFFQQHVSHERQLAGSRLVRLDRYVSIDRAGSHERENGPVCEALRPTSADQLDGLIQQAAHEVLQNVRAAYERSGVTELILDLSGGKDSRAVLAAVVAQGRDYLSRSRLNVKRSSTPGDEEVASGLADLFGARFHDGAQRPSLRRSPAQSSAHLRSYHLGTKFLNGASGRSSGGAPPTSLRVAGGVGEVTRGFWLSFFARHLSTEPSLDAFADWLCAREFKAANLPKAEMDDVAHVIATALSDLPGTNLAEALDLHYVFFRNRSHFGHSQYDIYHEQLLWHPLMSLSLLKASRSLQGARKRTPLIILRLTAALSPILPWVEYADFTLAESAHLKLMPPAWQSYPQRFPIDRDTSRWEASQASLAKSVRILPDYVDLPEVEPGYASVPEQMKHDIEAGLAYLQDRGLVRLPPEFLQRLAEVVATSDRKLGFSHGRVLSVSDTFAIFGS